MNAHDAMHRLLGYPHLLTQAQIRVMTVDQMQELLGEPIDALPENPLTVCGAGLHVVEAHGTNPGRAFFNGKIYGVLGKTIKLEGGKLKIIIDLKPE